MALQALTATRYVRVDGRQHLAWCFDSQTEDVVAAWPARLDGGPADRRLLRKGEYEAVPPDDGGVQWPADGPCLQRPTA
jgi:hypothetical protein